MTYPSDEIKNRDEKPVFMNVLPDRLNSLSASELADGLELALDYMTEENFDSEIVDAYLAALDARAPLPEHTDAETAYAKFCRRIDKMAEIKQAKSEPARKKRIYRRGIRAGLAAAVAACCLFGGMLAVQASGVDVFGAIARWTESVFSFSSPDSLAGKNDPSSDENIPDEYKELQAVLVERRLPLYIPKIPEEFKVDESMLYIHPNDGRIRFSILYMKENDYINYSLVENTKGAGINYEKDIGEIERFEYNDVLYYLFQNNDDTVVAWSIGDFEYILTSNLTPDFLKRIIKSDNQE